MSVGRGTGGGEETLEERPCLRAKIRFTGEKILFEVAGGRKCNKFY